jgi:hypothetical protein
VAGIVFLLVFAGIMLAMFFAARSRAKRDPVEARSRAAARLAEFQSLVERETGTRVELPESTISAVRRAAGGAPAAPEPVVPAAEPARRPKPTPRPAGPVRKPSPRWNAPQPVAPESLPALTRLDAMPELRRRRALPALAALAPLQPHAPLAPRAVRSP